MAGVAQPTQIAGAGYQPQIAGIGPVTQHPAGTPFQFSITKRSKSTGMGIDMKKGMILFSIFAVFSLMVYAHYLHEDLKKDGATKDRVDRINNIRIGLFLVFVLQCYIAYTI